MVVHDPGPKVQELSPTEALLLLLDQIDYTRGACGPTELIGALIAPDILAKCRRAAELEKQRMHASKK